MDNNVRAFLLEFVPRSSAALTLTMKQRDQFGKLDKIEASKNFRHFMNRLNQKALGNKFRRFGAKLEVLPVLERSYGGRLHYHAFIENPFDDVANLKGEISWVWSKTRWGYDEIDVQEIYNDVGWLNYITKSQILDNIDYENMHRV